MIHWTGVTSPFATAFSIPFSQDQSLSSGERTPAMGTYFPRDARMFLAYLLFSASLNAALFGTMIWLLNRRWRVSYGPTRVPTDRDDQDEPQLATLVE
jgi:hypothetical protein